MHLSRVKIKNFRNFSNVDVKLSSDIVILGENRVGKSNFLTALRLVLDLSMPDSARQLKMSDIWDGALEKYREEKIGKDTSDPLAPLVEVHLDFSDFDGDPKLTALLTDYRLASDHSVARLSYVLKPRDGVTDITSEADYDFQIYGGDDENRSVNPQVRKRISLDVLPALRDAESDLAVWRRSPLRPLLEDAISRVDIEEIDELSLSINEATSKLVKLTAIQSLEGSLRKQMKELAGERHDINARFGFSASDPLRIFRSIRILIDNGIRNINEASLGSANLALLTLKLAEFEWRRQKNERNYTLLAVEEPEAHLHPHLQRKVFKTLFSDNSLNEQPKRSLILTTHSPSIASVTPIKSIIMLRSEKNNETDIKSLAALNLEDEELEDLQRYLDSTRAEILFSRGIIFVEGDAEIALFPAFSRALGIDLDALGVSVCSVSGTNFVPYTALAASLGIPFSVVTDWDPRDDGKRAYGWDRILKIIKRIRVAQGKLPFSPAQNINLMFKEADLRDVANKLGIFTNDVTLETEIAKTPALLSPVLTILENQGFGPTLTSRIESWKTGSEPVDEHQLMLMIGYVSKGRFADELVKLISGIRPPEYIAEAINWVCKDL